MAALLEGPRKLVLALLERKQKPMTAYEILAELSTQGVSGPPTVYRALEKLMAEKLVHRIKSLNAYISCHHHHEHPSTSFAVCNGCGNVEEIHDARFEALIREISAAHHFQVQQEMIELVGLCGDCNKEAA